MPCRREHRNPARVPERANRARVKVREQLPLRFGGADAWRELRKFGVEVLLQLLEEIRFVFRTKPEFRRAVPERGLPVRHGGAR